MKGNEAAAWVVTMAVVGVVLYEVVVLRDAAGGLLALAAMLRALAKVISALQCRGME